MIGAGKSMGVSLTYFHDLRTPVAAHVDVGFNLPAVGADNEHRSRTCMHGLVVTGLPYLSRHGKHKRHTPEYFIHFCFPALFVVVKGRRYSIYVGFLFNGTCFCMRQIFVRHFN